MKTKIGISAGLIGAAAFFLGLVVGWIPVLLIAGYVLIVETNEWLRMSVVKAVFICTLFAVASAVIGLIPNAINIVDNVFDFFNKDFTIAIISKIIVFINSALNILEKLLLIALGFRALDQGTIAFGFIDNFIAKHINKDNTTAV